MLKDRKKQKIPEITEYIFRLLARRDYTENQLIRKLKKKEYPPGLIRESIEYFREKGLLNDEKFAFRYARARLASKPRGMRMLDFELSRKGIEKELRARIIKEVFKEYPEVDLALDVLKKKYGRRLDNPDLRNRAYQFLVRRGFSYEAVSEAIGRMGNRYEGE